MELVTRLDEAVLKWFQRFWGSYFDPVMIDLSALGGVYVLTFLVLFTVGLLLCLRRRRTAAFVLAAALGGVLLVRGLKSFFGRPRPPLHHPWVIRNLSSESFPSGHSMLSAIIFLTLALIASAIITRWRVRVYIVGASLVLVALIGISRIYLNVHYLSDVVAGWSVGLVWALMCRWIEFRWVLRRERRDAVE